MSNIKRDIDDQARIFGEKDTLFLNPEEAEHITEVGAENMLNYKNLDDCTYRGILHKTDDNFEKYGHPGFYFCTGFDDNVIFRSSRVKKVRCLG